SEHKESVRERESSGRALARCTDQVEAARAALRKRLDAARLAATGCGLAKEHDDERLQSVLVDSCDRELIEEVQRSLDEAMQTRRRSVRLLSQLNADADAARRTFQAESDRRGEQWIRRLRNSSAGRPPSEPRENSRRGSLRRSCARFRTRRSDS